MFAHATDRNTTVNDQGAARERLGLLGLQPDINSRFFAKQQRGVREAGEMQAALAVALAGADGIALDQRGQTGRALQGEFWLLDPELACLNSQTGGKLFQSHVDDGPVEFTVEMHFGHLAGRDPTENQPRLPLFHAGCVRKADGDLGADGTNVLEIHPAGRGQGDHRKKPGPRNAAPATDDMPVVFGIGCGHAHTFSSRQIICSL